VIALTNFVTGMLSSVNEAPNQLAVLTKLGKNDLGWPIRFMLRAYSADVTDRSGRIGMA